MSKTAAIRKRALEHAKKRDWEKALKEYQRIAEFESHNPNVFNEMGDIHLKMSNRAQAFVAFHKAIDAYSSMSLHNNSVAVCKKILRLNPDDSIVYGKLARLRSQQGFLKESESYAMMFLDRVVQDAALRPEELKERVHELADAMDAAPVVLVRIGEFLIKWEFKSDAGPVLEKAERGFTKKGMTAEAEATRNSMKSIGYVTAAGQSTDEFVVENGQVDLASSTDEPRMKIAIGRLTAEESPGPDVPQVEVRIEPSSSSELTAAAPPRSDLDFEIEPNSAADSTAVVETPPEPVALPDPSAETIASPAPTLPETATDLDDELTRTAEIASAPVETPNDGSTEVSVEPQIAVDTVSETADEVWVPASELPAELDSSDGEGGEYVKVSQIVGKFDAEIKATVDAEDYRSHYDLGMAYLEMDLLTEAVREFQTASRSSHYQVRSMEMVGLCFLKQEKPRLAVKQLERGLALVDRGNREALGLQYNLGLAYEMTGDIDKARVCFEDVYVTDVTFRDVQEKFNKYSA